MTRIWRAFIFSLHGIIAAWRDEAAFRQEIFLSAISIPAAIVFAPDNIALILMIGSVVMVLVVELINTAIEAAIDRQSLNHDDLAKKSKDCGSAAVLITLILAVFIWIMCLSNFKS